jgi:hypothetical protein
MTEWSNVLVLKTKVFKKYRGFESHSILVIEKLPITIFSLLYALDYLTIPSLTIKIVGYEYNSFNTSFCFDSYILNYFS